MSKLYDLIAEKYIELQEQILLESRIDFIKNQVQGKISTEHDKFAKHKNSDDIVDHFAEHGDPTKKKLYTGWIVKQYQQSGKDGKQPVYQEDAPKIHGILSKFEEFKHRIPNKDINSYKSIKEVSNAIEPFVKNPNWHKVDESEHPGRELKYEDDRIKLYHLKDQETSQKLYGGGPEEGKTSWCTAYPNSEKCMFDHYNSKGRLHVIHDKKTGKLYQYHAHEGQFMNAHDEPISDEEHLELGPHLHKAWEQDHSLVS